MKKMSIQLETLTCPSCALKIEGAVKTVPSVNSGSVKVLFNASKVKFEMTKEKAAIEDFEKAITKLDTKLKNRYIYCRKKQCPRARRSLVFQAKDFLSPAARRTGALYFLLH
jgi:copper chaperone CopZ